MDELIHKLKANDIGCHIGQHFTGAVCYADDLTLLSPSLRGLQKMLNICDEFANEYFVKFNAKKTVCIRFSMKVQPEDKYVYLSGEKLSWCNQVKHLGNILSYNLKDDHDIQLKRGYFYGSVNTLCAKFKCVLNDIDIASKLFQSYCCAFYGSQLWDLGSRCIDKIYIAWNKAVRRIFRLPYNTHRFLLPVVVGVSAIHDQLKKRFIKFKDSCDVSENSIIQMLLLNAQFENTPIGINMKFLCKQSAEKTLSCPQRESAGSLLCNLLRIRSQSWELNNFDDIEIEEMINFVCTS